MATKTIGVGTFAVSIDYATINLWDSYLNALTFTADETGRVLWSASASELVLADQTLDGSTPGANRIYLEAGDTNGAAGGSFRNNANAATNALRYNPANGAAIWFSGSNGLTITDPNITVRYLQFKANNAYSSRFLRWGTADSARELLSCILYNPNSTTGLGMDGCGYTAENNLFHNVGNISNTSNGLIEVSGGIPTIFRNCTIVKTETTRTSRYAIRVAYTSATITNCAFANFDKCVHLAGATGAQGGSNNATDQSAGVADRLPSGSIQVSLVPATEWVSLTAGSEDLRVTTASVKLTNSGITTGTSTDIIGQTRS